jgi:4-carboxymuconolactone decarboxylase
MAENKLETGMAIRRTVLGDAHVDRAEANKTDFDRDFQQMITEFAWGTVWAGEEIDRRTRHLLTIAILAALGKEHELTLHLRATRNTGVTPTELKAALQQVAVYAGIPAANTAFGIAKKVLAEMDEQSLSATVKEES